MNCEQVQTKLDAYLHGELPSKQEEGVRCHLDECRMCSEQRERILAMGKVLDELTVPQVPSDLSARVLRAAQERRTVRRALVLTLLQRPLVRRVAAMATIGVGLALGGFMAAEVTGTRNLEANEDISVAADYLGSVPSESLVAVFLSLNNGGTEN